MAARKPLVLVGGQLGELPDGDSLLGAQTDIAVQRFSGDGSQTGFTLSADPGTKSNTWVYIDGVYQQKDTYEVSGTALSFSEAPPAGTDNIEVMLGGVAEIGVPADESVTPAKLSQETVQLIEESGGGPRLLATLYYHESGTFQKAAYPGLAFIEIELVGGGGGGAGAKAAASGHCCIAAGGGAGHYLRKRIAAAALGESESVTIGAGGAGGVGTGTPGLGEDGGTTSFGTHASCPGGRGASFSSGTSAAFQFAGVVFDMSTDGDLNVAGAAGGAGIRMSGTVGRGGDGASGPWGGGSRGRGANADGEDGGGPGAGGSGACDTAETDRTGGHGADGVAIIHVYGTED